jgi:hypothetical protein
MPRDFQPYFSGFKYPYLRICNPAARFRTFYPFEKVINKINNIRGLKPEQEMKRNSMRFNSKRRHIVYAIWPRYYMGY